MAILTPAEIMGIRNELARRQHLLHERLSALATKKAERRQGKRKVPRNLLKSDGEGSSNGADNAGASASRAPRATRKRKAEKAGVELAPANPTESKDRARALIAARRIGATDTQLRAMGLIPATPPGLTVTEVDKLKPTGDSIMDIFA